MIYGIAVFSVLQCSYCPKRSAMISGKLYSIRGLLSSIFCPKRRASRMANARPRRGTRKPDRRIRGAAFSLISSSQNCYDFATKARASFMKISFFFSFSQIYPQFPQSFPQFLGKKRLLDVILTNLRKRNRFVTKFSTACGRRFCGKLFIQYEIGDISGISAKHRYKYFKTVKN